MRNVRKTKKSGIILTFEDEMLNIEHSIIIIDLVYPTTDTS